MVVGLRSFTAALNAPLVADTEMLLEGYKKAQLTQRERATAVHV